MALRKENILIVDDDIDILELLQRHLKSMDYHTYKAVSVKEALYILKDTYIDLLITDIQMPEVDGLQLLKVNVHVQSDQKLAPKVVLIRLYRSSKTTEYDTNPRLKAPRRSGVQECRAHQRAIVRNKV